MSEPVVGATPGQAGGVDGNQLQNKNPVIGAFLLITVGTASQGTGRLPGRHP